MTCGYFDTIRMEFSGTCFTRQVEVCKIINYNQIITRLFFPIGSNELKGENNVLTRPITNITARNSRLINWNIIGRR